MDRDYVLGTHDEEIERLGLQHRVWRARALDGWRRAGIAPGQKVIDFGAGPGWASLDLAEMVGASGEVVALERSTRFLAHLRAVAAARGLPQIRAAEVDVVVDALPVEAADAAWGRWILAFLPKPEATLAKLVAALKPGGALVFHEYLDYRAWRLSPRTPSIERFCDAVMQSWRAAGGEPDVGLDLPRWLEAAGCRIESLTPIVDVIAPSSFAWGWPASFIDVNVARLVDLGLIGADDGAKMRADFAAASADPATRMVTPIVLEVVARKL